MDDSPKNDASSASAAQLTREALDRTCKLLRQSEQLLYDTQGIARCDGEDVQMDNERPTDDESILQKRTG